MTALSAFAYAKTTGSQLSASGNWTDRKVHRHRNDDQRREEYKPTVRLYDKDEYPIAVMQDGERMRNAFQDKATIPTRHHNTVVKERFLNDYRSHHDVSILKLALWEVTEKEYLAAFPSNANNAPQQAAFELSVKVADDMQFATGFMSDLKHMASPKILDLSLGHGGFSTSVREHLPYSEISGIAAPYMGGTLKIDDSVGYVDLGSLGQQRDEWRSTPANIWRNDPAQVIVTDITMLYREFTDIDMPAMVSDLEPSAYLSTDAFRGEKFDLVKADGHVLDPKAGLHPFHSKVDAIKLYKLLAAEIVLGLKRLDRGGTFVILLHPHEFNGWDTFKFMCQMHAVSKEVSVYKSSRVHELQNSFYFIARGVDTHHDKCQALIAHWKKIWEWTVLGAKSNELHSAYAEKIVPLNHEVEDLLNAKVDFVRNLLHNVTRKQDRALKDMLYHIHAVNSKYADYYYRGPRFQKWLDKVTYESKRAQEEKEREEARRAGPRYW